MSSYIVASETELEQIKKTELNILLAIRKICQEENIEYFLAGGTLLGAVRHKGFIPWDDDIDIAMKRDDYDRFCECCKKYLPEYMKLVNTDTDPYFGLGFSKLMDMRSEFGEIFTDGIPVSKGIFVDIFPLDNAPDSKIKKQLHKMQRYYWKKMLMLKSHYNFQKHGIKNLAYKLLKIYAGFFTKKYICRKLKKISLKYNKNSTRELVSVFSTYDYEKESMKQEWFLDTTELEFEGHLFTVPGEYEMVLKQLYGDYMKLPPKEARVNRHELATLCLYKKGE